MHIPITQTAHLLFLPAAILTTLGILARAGRLPMNSFSGIRLPSLMKNRATWKKGHQAAGPWITGAGVFAAVFALCLMQYGPTLEAQFGAQLLELVFVLCLLALTLNSARVAVKAAKSVPSK